MKQHRLPLTLLLALLAAIPLTNVQAAEKRPNVIVVLADDLGYGDLACYGHPFIKTPNLDLLAKQGLRFTDFHAGSSICSPSRAVLLTGRSSYRVGVYHLSGEEVHLRREEITIAEVLKESGYRTFYAGKWHLGQLSEKHPSPGEQGFDHWLATPGNPRNTENPKGFIRNGKAIGETRGYYCDLIVEECINWIRKGDPDKPFFAQISASEPHAPVTPPESYAAVYDSEEIRQKQKLLPHGGVPRMADEDPTHGKYYYGMVSQLDNAVGKLMWALKKQGLEKNTLVIFTSDNGPEYPGGSSRRDRGRDRSFGTPGAFRGQKRFLYEGGIRVPGIFRWPSGIAAGSVSEVPAGSVDLLPTICELAGARVPADRAIDGTSLVPAFLGRKPQRSTPLFWNINYTQSPNMAMRLGDEVLVARARAPSRAMHLRGWIKSTRLERFELYNLREDPAQTKDLADRDPEHFRKLVDQIERLWFEVQHAGPRWTTWEGGRIKPAQMGYDG